MPVAYTTFLGQLNSIIVNAGFHINDWVCRVYSSATTYNILMKIFAWCFYNCTVYFAISHFHMEPLKLYICPL